MFVYMRQLCVLRSLDTVLMDHFHSEIRTPDHLLFILNTTITQLVYIYTDCKCTHMRER